MQFSVRGKDPLNGKNGKVRLAAVLILVLVGGFAWTAMRAQPGADAPTLSEAKRDKILSYIRNRFGVPDTVKLSLGALQASAWAPTFDEAQVSVADGKSQRTQQILLSNDQHYLIVVIGGILSLQSNSSAEMIQRIRETFKTPPSLKLTIGGFRRSPSPDFEEGTLSMDDGRSKQERVVLLAHDGRHLIVSEMYNLDVDPRQQALRTISLHDEPTIGPADAPVTIVEYADLECPTCARMHDFLATQVIPRFGNRVRVVFKEFPLVAVHDWSFTAAIACQCAYEMNPTSYFPLRTAIFRNQQMINITNLRDTLLNFGEQVGLNRVQLAGCIDSKSSLPRVERDMEEAKRLNVNQTPTVYINGRMLVGLPSDQAYMEAIEAALHGGVSHQSQTQTTGPR